MYDNYDIISKKKREFLKKKVVTMDISFFEGLMILYIGNNPKQNQEILSLVSGVDKYRTAKLLTAMESKNLIIRKQNPENKREKLVELSKEGEKKYEVFKKWANEWREICFKGFNKEEIDTFMGLLEKMLKNIDN